MSLRVWLPLNGTLDNQGLDDITPVLTGAVVVDDEGKIGKCYKFGTSLGRIIIPPTVMRNYTECSVTFWVNILGWQTNWDTFFQAGLGSSPWNNYIFGVLRNSGNSVVFTISSASSSSQGNYKSSDLTLNTWYHLGFTYKSGHCCIYVNGNLYKDYSTNIIPNFGGINYISLGQLGNASSYQTNCKMNDFRIYDHCLSPMEVKEISKGLILHYPLSDAYVETGQNLCTVLTSNIGAQTWGGHSTTWTIEDATNFPIPINKCMKAVHTYTNTGGWGGYSRSIQTIFALPSTIYTFSCYMKVSDNFDYTNPNFIYYYEYNSSGTKLKEGGLYNKTRMEFIGDGWYRCWGTFTTQATTTSINISFYSYAEKNTTHWVGGWQIEQKDHMTPFMMPGTNRNNNIVYDNSGFYNNGTLMTNTITTSTDTPKYQISTHFNGTYDGILIENLQLSNIINTAITYAFWIKPESESGARSIYFGSYSNTSWSIEKTTSNVLRLYWNGSPDETCSGATIIDGVWQHICITKNGTSDVKVYVNGVQKWSSTTMHNTLSFPTTYRLGRDMRSNDGTPYKGLMSDFRIYATALSADDVKSLYNNSAYIDNQGNIYGAVYEEV